MKNKKIVCIDDGTVFDDISHLSVKTRIYEEHILRHLKGKTSLLGGKKYKYQ